MISITFLVALYQLAISFRTENESELIVPFNRIGAQRFPFSLDLRLINMINMINMYESTFLPPYLMYGSTVSY